MFEKSIIFNFFQHVGTYMYCTCKVEKQKFSLGGGSPPQDFALGGGFQNFQISGGGTKKRPKNFLAPSARKVGRYGRLNAIFGRFTLSSVDMSQISRSKRVQIGVFPGFLPFFTSKFFPGASRLRGGSPPQHFALGGGFKYFEIPGGGDPPPTGGNFSTLPPPPPKPSPPAFGCEGEWG